MSAVKRELERIRRTAAQLAPSTTGSPAAAPAVTPPAAAAAKLTAPEGASAPVPVLAPPSAPAKPKITPKEDRVIRGVRTVGIGAQVQALYDKNDALGRTITTANMKQFFLRADGKPPRGRSDALGAFQRYIVTQDPVSGGPVTFLGRKISGGVNAYMLPMLKAAEAELSKAGNTYQPRGSAIFGYNFRGMMIGGVPSETILSSHSAGLSLDIDAGNNGPKDNSTTNRGDIPDAVVLTLVALGFTWGGVVRKGYEELGNDPMHFQFTLHPDGAHYAQVLAQHPVAKAYFDALTAKGALPPVGPKP